MTPDPERLIPLLEEMRKNLYDVLRAFREPGPGGIAVTMPLAKYVVKLTGETLCALAKEMQ